jgi:CRISPR/Cas system-associated exonuclease Cas4 (RecB family)
MGGKWKEWHGWSRSRQSLLDACPRRYYYRYVKFYEVPYGDILKETKGMLDNMTQLKFLLGNIVHDAIKRQFDQLSRGRDVSGPDSALQYVSRYINDIKNDPKKFIIEALNDEEISEEEISRMGKEAERQVKIFFNEFFDFYEHLEIVTHEKYCKIIIDGHVFWVVPDLITKSKDGRLYITDWKTDSSYSNAPDEWQMKQYILWALEEDLSDLDNIRTEVIFLDIGESKDYKTTQQDLDSFKEELVKKSKELFEYLDSQSGKDDFKKREDEEICIGCGFKSYCEAN